MTTLPSQNMQPVSTPWRPGGFWILCLAATLVGLLLAQPSHAAGAGDSTIAATTSATTKYVANAGKDQTGCGAVKSPCATLQYAHNASTDGGQIIIRDAGSYGAVSITKAITIRNGSDGIALISASSGKVAVTVNAGSDAVVTLDGLTLDGYGRALQGIVWESGRRITIRNCDARGFTDSGIVLRSITPMPTAFVEGGLLTENGAHGLVVAASKVAISASATGTTSVNNRLAGFLAIGGAGGSIASLDLLRIKAGGNSRGGNASVDAYAQNAFITLGDSFIANDNSATAEAGGTLCSYKNNYGNVSTSCSVNWH
ncbi:hypothetical protein [Oryzibacter oryziterrae]|uniref:hypothetical protein n=1 Tax=Oryzibacter oryziterrae TaxID=2766474 RepID=UPI001F292FCE|nr:hypothetical protein [Oryzibacter oryziterrae]